MATIAELVDRSRSALAALGVVAEAVEDEWPYIEDLVAAWSSELDRVVAARGSDPTRPEVEAAIDRLIDEIERISDPHRAIDWLSTFPQAALLALANA